jgi:long-chain acyl-CoA synthetase
MMTYTKDVVTAQEAGTLSGLFLQRVRRSPRALAYRQFDRGTGAWCDYTWSQMHALVGRWQRALAGEALEPGDRVAIWLPNGIEWVCLDQAALSLALVGVPLYTSDSPANVAYILADSGCRLLVVAQPAQWQALSQYRDAIPALRRVICLAPDEAFRGDGLALSLAAWLPGEAELREPSIADPNQLATIVYTSGTTGRPKGVMLSHRNILCDAEAIVRLVPTFREDVFLSFLPLSHAFERTVGYYLPMMTASSVAYARSIEELAEDLTSIRPTVLISVPRIYERVYGRLQQKLAQRGRIAGTLFRTTEYLGWHRFEAAQGRAPSPGMGERLLWPLLNRMVAGKILARLGGRIRLAISGGAPLNERIARCFIGMGLPLLQGYGLTEAAPVVSGNRPQDNIPASVGEILPGIDARVDDHGELLVRGPNVMLGYWGRPKDTRDTIDQDGWLRTGDIGEIRGQHLFIRGRIKEILVLSTGEKVAPADLEMTLVQAPLFDQAMLVGEGRPFLGALLVLQRDEWHRLARELSLAPEDRAALAAPTLIQAVLGRVAELLSSFPGHAQVRAVYLTLEPWTIEGGLLTPTMKLKRPALEQRFAHQIRDLYAGHLVVD